MVNYRRCLGFLWLIMIMVAFAHADTLTKGARGAEDLSWATGGNGNAETLAQNRQIGTISRTFTVTKIDTSHLKSRTVIDDATRTIEELVNGAYSLTLLLKEIIVQGPEVDARAFGLTRGKTAIDAALAYIGSKHKTLIFYPDLTDTTTTWSIGTNLNFPSTLTVRISRGALLAPATGTTTTFNGTFEAGIYKTFSPIGNGKVVFGPGVVAKVYPQWFGTTGNYDIAGDTGTDDFAAFQKACDSLYPAGGKIHLPTGVYYVTEAVRLRPNTILEGEGEKSVLYAKAATFQYHGPGHRGDDYSAYILRIPNGEYTSDPVADNCVVKNIKFKSDGHSNNSNTYAIVYNGPGGVITRCNNTVVENCSFEGLYREALNAYGTARRNITFRRNSFYNCNFDAICFNGPHSGEIVDNYIYKCGWGIEASGGTEGTGDGIPYYNLGGLIVLRNNIIGVWQTGIRVPSMGGTGRTATNGIIITDNIILGDRVSARYPVVGINITMQADGVNCSNNIIRWVDQIGIQCETSTTFSNRNIIIQGNQIVDIINSRPVAWSSGICLGGGGGAGLNYNVLIANNIIKCTNFTTYRMNYGILIAPTMREPLSINGNHISGVKYVGIYAENCYIQNWQVLNNYIELTGANGIVIDNATGTGHGVTINGNTIYNNLATQTNPADYGKRDIWLENLKWAKLINNTLHSIQISFPIFLRNCTDLLENNNVVDDYKYNCEAIGTSGTVKGTYQEMVNGSRKVAYILGSSAPSGGRWKIGCIAYKLEPVAGATPGWVCTSPSMAQGWGDATGSKTTGKIESGTAILEVASAAGWEVGDALTIAGAGAGGTSITARVEAISGTTFTISTKASTTVKVAACTHVSPTWKAMSNLGR